MRRKKMSQKTYHELLSAGNSISKNHNKYDISAKYAICQVIGNSWMDTEEAFLIDPYKGDSINKCVYWWGFNTKCGVSNSQQARGARLIGIAMMLTMPVEIINHECVPLKKKKNEKKKNV